MKKVVALLCCGASVALVVALSMAGCGDGTDAVSGAFTGTVQSAEGTAVAGATVYLVPTTSVDQTQITTTNVRTGINGVEDYDEPLEDAVRISGTTFKQATTDATGAFSISGVPDGDFFVYVAPPAGDTEHKPGGDKCRNAYSASQLRSASLTIKVSSSPSSSATYIGSKSCMGCHTGHVNVTRTAHKNGIMPAGTPGAQQNLSLYPSFNNALTKFTSAATYAGGTRLDFGDYDSTRTFDKLEIYESTDPLITQLSTKYGEMYLWKATAGGTGFTSGKYYITIVNTINAADPNDPLHIEVKFTYGGAVYKQRFLVGVPAALATRKGLYYMLQYNLEGSNARYDRNRRVWRDYKFADDAHTASPKGFWSYGTDVTVGTGDDLLVAPSVTKTFQGECAACHFTGYERYTDGTTGEYLARAANNEDGEANIDDDPATDEMNVGCEFCHGPGSEHISQGNARRIVAPQFLSPERESVICAQCHDRPTGPAAGGGNEQPLDSSLKMMRPGESRAYFLANHVDSAKRGPDPGSGSTQKDVWKDGSNDNVHHSKSHHQQYSDHIKSKHYKNTRKLVVCSDCHDMHGDTTYRHELVADPDVNTSTLCQRCHTVDTLSHVYAKTGSYMNGTGAHCVDCHVPKTAQSGSGRYGSINDSPTFPFTSSSDESTYAYWENDISSHVFKFTYKTSAVFTGVATRSSRIPIPYTNSCGTCHTPP